MNNFYMIHNSQSTFYRSPFGAVKQGEKVEIYIELEHDAKVFISLTNFDGTKEFRWMDRDNERSSWKKNFYKTVIDTKDKLGILYYYFQIEREGEIIYYGNNLDSLGGEGQVYFQEPKQFQITIYKDFKVPDWYKQGVIYQIFVDRFYNGNDDGTVTHPKENSFIYSKWDDNPLYIRDSSGRIERWDFYGGNLKGVLKKLEYLKTLGVNIIYFNPIFKAKSCHKYDTADYEEIDEMFGTNEDFEKLCAKAMELGIRIILDGVFSHTGDDSKYFNKYGKFNSLGAAQSKDSQYFKWYRFYDYPSKYECWWGIDNQPNVDEMNESYIDYIIESENSIIAKWMRLGASGWRLDVADELPDEFIKFIKRRMKREKNDSVLIGEVWEDASSKISYGQKREYLFGSSLDSVTNYPLRDAIISFCNKQISSNKLSKKIMNLYENYPRESFYSTMNILGNHDTERILTALGNNKQKLKIALAIQILMPGVPLIYYGDEAGVQGGKDPDNRRAFPWGNVNSEIYSWVKFLIDIRNKNEAIKSGELKFHNISENIFGLERFIDKTSFLIIISNTNKDETATIPYIDGKYKDYLNPMKVYCSFENRLDIKFEPYEC
ncbi:MAG: glycoside hydrolase family 13 protein, partial [Sarcina sp.]